MMLKPRRMNRSTTGRMADAFSGTFSANGIFQPSCFSTRIRASSIAWVQPPSFLTLK